MTRTRNSARSAASHFEESALFEFSKVINSSLDPAFIANHILLTIMGKILAARGMILLKRQKGLTVQTVKGFAANLVGRIIAVPRFPTVPVNLRGTGAPRSPWVKEMRELGVAFVLPMEIAGKPVGLLCFGDRLAPRPLNRREMTFLQSLANISATALETSRTVEELRQVNRQLDRKIQELNTLFELGKEFGREFEAMREQEKLVRLLVFSLLGQVGVNRYLVCLKDGHDMRVVASRLDGPVPQGELLNALARLKAPAVIADLPQWRTVDPKQVLQELRLAVAVPMQIQGESKGLMFLGEKLNREPFTQADLEFLFSLGNLAIISLENARLFREALEKQRMDDELLIAREIQKGLLPSVLPVIHGMEIAATNISSKQVGGDYYDVVGLSDERHVIAIGDVSGKGSPAALLMANLQATIRALVPLEISLPVLTARVNDLMCGNTGGNKFVTFFWGILDSKARTLEYVNAGHNYPYLVHADGAVDRLDRGGMILGVLKTEQPYEEGMVTFRSGDLLVLFTDGVSEAMSKEGEEYGEERLERLLVEHRNLAASAVLEAIHHDVLTHTRGAAQSDDITLMIVRLA